MSDNETDNSKPFCIDRPKQGRATCKKCKQKCDAGELRIGKIVTSAFGSGLMKSWHHLNCMFDVFHKQRATTKRLDSPEDLDGWDVLSETDRDVVMQRIEEFDKIIAEKDGGKRSASKKNVRETDEKLPEVFVDGPSTSGARFLTSLDNGKPSKDGLFREFRRLVADVTNVSSYLEKTSIVRKLFVDGSDGNGFKSDVALWCRLLLPGSVKRVYNLQSKQLVKLFARTFRSDQDKMLEHLEQGDIGETVQRAFEESTAVVPSKKSLLSLEQVDDFLDDLSRLTKDDERMRHIETFLPRCTANDLKVIVRLIKHDLRMNAGAKHILDAVHPEAYRAFQASRDINSVVDRALASGTDRNSTGTDRKDLKATIVVMKPVLPMLAEACKSVEQAMKKCPNGMYSEIKYDGERVQVHKRDTEFKYFSRSLKPVMAHKVKHFEEFIPQAFPHADDLILDSEILMIDCVSGKPLPFGTLGKHKRNELDNANVCLFVFDCIYYNGEVLTHEPLKTRKRILQENMIEIPNRIVLSELEEVDEPQQLAAMIAKVLKLGLEGLVLKDVMSVYEPGKRHWLKVKKDYLFDGAMADSADLIVLGAWYGTGKKGGMMSVFLMGCYDEMRDTFCTVTKVHTGHDDGTLERLQTELKMCKISGDPDKIPSWLRCAKTMMPDFVADDPKKQPVWEITGAEFTRHDVHTADGISVRFPRVTRIRDDKTWKSATTLDELKVLYKNSKENMDVSLLLKNAKDLTAVKEKTRGPSKRSNSSSASTKDNDELIVKKRKDSSSDIVIKDPLPDVFVDVKLLVLDKPYFAINYSDLIRHFIGYGGVLLTDTDWQEATHVLHKGDCVSSPSDNCPVFARHITADWIKDCIDSKELVDTRKYPVRWIP